MLSELCRHPWYKMRFSLTEFQQLNDVKLDTEKSCMLHHFSCIQLLFNFALNFL